MVGCFLMWEEVFQLATTISFEDSDDALIWKFNSNGVCILHSHYIK